ncbi:hypothetical protein ABVT39_006892 [Epinephelus coioides]
MFLLLVRTSALTLLLSLIAEGHVATATPEQGLTCRQEIPAELIRELWSRTKQLINKLPKEETFSRRHRLLPKVCTKCSERAIGWLEVRELIDVYQRSVFRSEVVQKLLPLHYNDLLHRIQHTLQHCVSSSQPSKWFKIIKKLERKIKKHLKQAEIGSSPLFDSVIKSINTSCQRKVHLMNVTLDVYTRIFTSILQHNQHQDKTRTHLLDQLSDQESSQVVSVVTELQKNIQELKKHLSHVSHERQDLLSKLNTIDVDDPVVQRKALAEFKEVYQAASVIGHPSCGHAHASSAERR